MHDTELAEHFLMEKLLATTYRNAVLLQELFRASQCFIDVAPFLVRLIKIRASSAQRLRKDIGKVLDFVRIRTFCATQLAMTSVIYGDDQVHAGLFGPLSDQTVHLLLL